MRFLLSALLLLVTSGISFAQTPATPDPQQSKILALENAWNQAEEHKDAKALETLLHPDLVYIDYDGSIMSKGQFIASIKAPTLKPEQIVNESMSAHVFGDSAVVSGIYREKGIKDGKPYLRRGRFTDTWIYQNGLWMCVASQSTLIAQ